MELADEGGFQMRICTCVCKKKKEGYLIYEVKHEM
jgi:hypothetical protein